MTSTSVVRSSKSLEAEPPKPPESIGFFEVVDTGPSPLAERIAADPSLRALLQRNICLEVAEELIRLRNYREMSQQQVATKAGTSQSVVARHESGRSNMSLKTIEQMLEALNGVVRVELIPAELQPLCSMHARWWQLASAFDYDKCLSMTVIYKANYVPKLSSSSPFFERLGESANLIQNEPAKVSTTNWLESFVRLA